ncbi:ADP-ribosylation factor GTPase-activating protein [Abortiporus biennis]
MDQAVARRTLQELIKREDLENKKCVDCGNPNPQWASLSFAVFLCLQCAGVHRGFGVHVSFVRSVSMDTWQEEQVKRMQLGGNGPFKQFMKSYPAEGGYKQDMSPYDTYHCWAASQYREKLDAELAGKPWSQSSPPANYNSPANNASPPGRPSSAQGLRKSRASTRVNTGRPSRNESASPASFSNPISRTSTPNPDQKTANESYFATLGQANASRSADLPPSQGGRYQGFGNTPAPSGSQHPSYGLSSAAAPSLSDFQESPVAALSKGWSLLSAAVVGASRVVSENVIQPAAGKVMDPTFQAGVRGYVSEAGKKAGEVGKSANMWGKNAFGVDVAEQVGGVVGAVKDRVAGPDRRGYGALPQSFEGETSPRMYDDHEDDDAFFHSYAGAGNTGHQESGLYGSSSTIKRNTNSSGAAKKSDEWDDWKDF